MAAPKGNEFWKARSTHGKEKIFSTPEILWDAACQYFQWCLDNPLMEAVVISKGIRKVVKDEESGEDKAIVEYLIDVPKMRAMTVIGLCIFLDISTQTFLDYYNNKEDAYEGYLVVTTRIKEIIRSQKFEGAAAGFLNANIIARDLGLAEKKDIELTNKNRESKLEEALSKLPKETLTNLAYGKLNQKDTKEKL